MYFKQRRIKKLCRCELRDQITDVDGSGNMLGGDYVQLFFEVIVNLLYVTQMTTVASVF